MTDVLNEILTACEQNKIACYKNYSLKNLTTFRVGGNAALFIGVENVIQATSVQKLVNKYRPDFFVLGGGSNLLISDNGFDGVVLQLQYPEKIEVVKKSDNRAIISIPSNIRSAMMAKKVSRMGYTGMEFLTTIPGFIGGAIVQNAGCYGSEIRDILIDVDLSIDGQIHTLTNSELLFSYRSSIFKKHNNYLIHRARFGLSAGNPQEIDNHILEFQNKRLQNQPLERKNAGSVFKNPLPQKAWYYIQECSLGGYSIGDAVISPKHANFIVNRGNATAQNIYDLIKHIQENVFQKFNITLEPEIILLGKF